MVACDEPQGGNLRDETDRAADKDSLDAGKRDASKRDASKGDARGAEEVLTDDGVQIVKRVEDAVPGIFIPPFPSCEPARDGEPEGRGPDKQVCTNVAISGATEPGRKFADYASCDVVRTQRPFWPAPPAGTAAADDARLEDPAYLAELGWVKEQVKATGCVCCHDSSIDGQASQWDIELGPLWIDSLSDPGLALFAGLADSYVLGAYPPEDNNGFARDLTGLPSDDPPRMQAFMLAELARRGISEESARAVPPFGGPIYSNQVAEPEPCGAGEGVSPDDVVHWRGGEARYVYVMEAKSDNPGVPPNLDLPEGTLLRIDVLASQPGIASGFTYGKAPDGAFQSFPKREPAAALVEGTRYHFYVLRDVGLPLANCLFTYGEAVPEPPAADAGRPTDASAVKPNDAGGGTCQAEGGDAKGFGAPCTDTVAHSDCPCEADYCAVQPGQKSGYCTKTGCKEDADICPSDWKCFDLGMFLPGQPAICTR